MKRKEGKCEFFFFPGKSCISCCWHSWSIGLERAKLVVVGVRRKNYWAAAGGGGKKSAAGSGGRAATGGKSAVLEVNFPAMPENHFNIARDAKYCFSRTRGQACKYIINTRCPIHKNLPPLDATLQNLIKRMPTVKVPDGIKRFVLTNDTLTEVSRLQDWQLACLNLWCWIFDMFSLTLARIESEFHIPSRQAGLIWPNSWPNCLDRVSSQYGKHSL